MSATPRPIHDAAAAFDSLPGIGPRAALRYAYWLASQPKDVIHRFARSLDAMADGVRRCQICGLWSDADTCSICRDPRREETSLCIVGTSQDARVIEESGAFKGKYHVLGGLLDPVEGRTPETLNIPSLIRRLSSPENKIKEIILALDPDVSGDTTALYLMRQLAPLPLSITRLARGLQTGAQIEYADGSTIADALNNRKSIGKNSSPTPNSSF